MSNATVQVVADTNILIWYLLEPGKLTTSAQEALEAETSAGRAVGVSAWALVEIGYAAEKPSNPLTVDDRAEILAELAAPDCPFEVVAVDADIAARVALVPREPNADPGDRVVVATAEVLGASHQLTQVCLADRPVLPVDVGLAAGQQPHPISGLVVAQPASSADLDQKTADQRIRVGHRPRPMHRRRIDDGSQRTTKHLRLHRLDQRLL